MSTWNAVYFRGELPAGFRPAVEGRCEARPLADWVELQLPGVEDGEPTALALSRLLSGPVVWGLVQTTASVVGIVHCEQGRVRRGLEFADGSWRRVEGQPQAWESFFFSDEELEAARDIGSDDDDEALEAAFARRTLTVGATYPWPREWETLFHAIGVSQAQWEAARATPPHQVLQGRRTSTLTLFVRGSLLLGGAAVVAALLMPHQARDFGALAFAVLCLALGAGAVRRVSLGRWLL